MDYTQVGGLTIWIATRRMHIEYHNVSKGATATDCGRSVATNGAIVARPDLEALWARPCPRCWPTDPNAVGPTVGE